MRDGVPSEVPPNFCTRMGLAMNSGCALNIALPRQPFRQEDRALAGAELRIVREHDVLDPFQDGFIANPSDGYGHPVAGISVTARLWPEGVRVDAQQPIGRGGQTLQAIDAKGIHRGRRRSRLRRALGADEDRLQVAIPHVDAGAGGGDRERCRLAPVTEDLSRLALDLLLL